MDFMLFVGLSAVYIMFIHFAVGIWKEFNIATLITYFIIGGILGYYLQSYEAGFVFGVVMSFMLWNNIFG